MIEATLSTLPVLDSPVRRLLVNTLANLPQHAEASGPTREQGLTAAELAERVGLHVTTVRFHLERLSEVGLVEKHSERVSVGRPRQYWTAVPDDADPSGSATARMLAEVLSEALDAGDADAATSAGRRWALSHADELGLAPQAADTPGAWLAQVGAVVDVLDRWGYEPSVSTTDRGRTSELCLHRCPLIALVEQNPDVACGVHRGVIEGTLEALGERDVEIELHPFLRPDECVATIVHQTPFARPSSGKAQK